MLDLTPVKLLSLFIVVMVLVGPDKLPQVARQLGSGWRKLQEYRDRVDQEVRQNIPDLPSSQEIVRFARSPIALLNQLASTAATPELVPDPGDLEPRADAGSWPADPADPAVRGNPADPPDPSVSTDPPDLTGRGRRTATAVTSEPLSAPLRNNTGAAGRKAGTGGRATPSAARDSASAGSWPPDDPSMN